MGGVGADGVKQWVLGDQKSLCQLSGLQGCGLHGLCFRPAVLGTVLYKQCTAPPISLRAVELHPPAPRLAVQRAGRYLAGRDGSSVWTHPSPLVQREAERSNHFHAQPLPIPAAACSST